MGGIDFLATDAAHAGRRAATFFRAEEQMSNAGRPLGLKRQFDVAVCLNL